MAQLLLNNTNPFYACVYRKMYVCVNTSALYVIFYCLSFLVSSFVTDQYVKEYFSVFGGLVCVAQDNLC